LLAIVYGWRENDLKRARYWLHGLPVGAGFVLAFAGIPFYTSILMVCYIPPPGHSMYVDLTWWHNTFLTIVPIFFSIISTSICILLVYWRVRKTTRRAARWRLGDQSCMLEKRVLIQFLLYLASFYVTWPLLLAALLDPSLYRYNFWVVVSFVGPLQGFNNALVYACPRLLMKDKKLVRMRQSIVMEDSGMFSGMGSRFLRRITSFSNNNNLRSSYLDSTRSGQDTTGPETASDDASSRVQSSTAQGQPAYDEFVSTDRTTSYMDEGDSIIDPSVAIAAEGRPKFPRRRRRLKPPREELEEDTERTHQSS